MPLLRARQRFAGSMTLFLRLREKDMITAPRAHWSHLQPGALRSASMSRRFRWICEHGTLHIPDVRTQSDFPKVGSVRGGLSFLGHSPSPAGGTHRNADRASHRGAPLHPGADRAARNLRRPGRDRDRERPAVPRTQGIIGAADGHE